MVDEDKEEEQDPHDAIERMVEVEEKKQRKLCVNAEAVWVTFFVAKSLVISV